MKNFQFSELLNLVTRNVLLFAYTSNVATLKAYFDKNAPKNEILQKMVFRYSDTLLTEKQKIETMSSVLSDPEALPNLKNGSMQVVYNDYFKQNILLINNTFAIMCNVSQLPNIESKQAYNETLLSLFIFLSQPQTITSDAKKIATMLFQNTPYPCGKQYINSLKYLSSDVQNEFIALNDSFVPVKNEVTFFNFAPKVEKAVVEKAVVEKAVVEKAVVEKAVVDTPPAKSEKRLNALQKMQLIYEYEKSLLLTYPKTKSNIAAIKKHDLMTPETVCNELHQKSELKAASLASFLNSEVAKIQAKKA